MTDTLANQVTQINPNKPQKRVQISAKVRTAVKHMVWDAMDRKQAATAAGITDSALYQALRLPKVKTLMKQELAELREGAPFKAYANIVNMADNAKSEDVRLRSNQWVAGVDGIAPVKQVRGEIKVTHGFDGYSYGEAVDGVATEDE